MHRLKLGEEDRVVLLGDMIDRGPDSAGVIEYVREHPQIIAIKGNHEQMAIQSLQERRIELNTTWMAKGGASTWGSYIVAAKGDLHRAKLTFAEDCAWMADLPSHIVLDDWRLVHAGYHPRIDLDSQDEKTLLWIRRAFFKHDEAIDDKRCILFGHTPTTKFKRSGQIAHSKIILDDGRPSWVALDTCAYNEQNPGIAAYDLCTGKTILQKTLRSEYWWLRSKTREAPVAESFGLVELRRRAQKAVAAREKAARRLAMAGVSRTVKAPISFRVVKRKLPLMEDVSPSSGIQSRDSVIFRV
jgi:serine/threonine protein phosphatase 1